MKKNFGLYLILFALLLCSCGQPSTGRSEEDEGPTWQEQYDLGVRYLSDGNYEEAIIAFTAAIEIDPKRSPAYVGRGDAYVLSGETKDNLTAARLDYEKAIELDEVLAEAYLGLADVYIRKGDYDKALEILEQGLEKSGENEKISGKIDEINSGNISDSSGNARRMTSYDPSGAVQWWHDYTYTPQGREDSVTAFNASGDQIGYMKLSYNETGRPLIHYNYSSETGELSRQELTYDANGNMITSVTYDTDGAVLWRVAYTYDANGNIISDIAYNPDGTVMDATTNTYNSAGQVIRRDQTNASGSTYYTLYEYDAQGNQTKSSWYSEDGILGGYEIRTYHEDGRLDGYVSYRDNEQEYRVIMRYDEKGNHIGTDHYDGAGNLTNSEVYH